MILNQNLNLNLNLSLNHNLNLSPSLNLNLNPSLSLSQYRAPRRSMTISGARCLVAGEMAQKR